MRKGLLTPGLGGASRKWRGKNMFFTGRDDIFQIRTLKTWCAEKDVLTTVVVSKQEQAATWGSVRFPGDTREKVIDGAREDIQTT
jgi:hypothetical protein